MPSLERASPLDRLDDVLGDTPSPSVVTASTEKCRQLLANLGDPGLQEVANAKLEGYKNLEIAQRRGCMPRAVERKLKLIRDVWKKPPH